MLGLPGKSGPDIDPSLTYPIPPIYHGRRLVIPDIHGCIRTFRNLIRQISLNFSDQLFLLGDYINKGPDSAGVIDYIMNLQEDGYQIFCLRGNHEENLLQALSKDRKTLMKFTIEHQSQNLLNKSGKLKKRYFNFISTLPYFYELDHYYLVHAGFNFLAANPVTDKDAMLNIRDYPVEYLWTGNKRIIHGHNPKPLRVIMAAIETRSPVIPLDNGCVYANSRTGQGHLLCLDLHSLELTLQENIDNYY